MAVMGLNALASENDNGSDLLQLPEFQLVIDTQYGHNRSYPIAGLVTKSLPHGYMTTVFRGEPYFIHGGVWYRRADSGYQIIIPPLGATIPVLPPNCTNLTFGNLRYFYANHVHYRWVEDLSAWMVSEPPAIAADSISPLFINQLLVKPNNRQSLQKQSSDTFECYRLSTLLTGFDESKPLGGVNSSEYDKKLNEYKNDVTRCLETRGL